ncbi:MAG: amidohydrolase family protein [Phycisphaerae bacterium]
MIVRARWVWAAGRGLIENGAARVQDGRIAEIESGRRLGGGPTVDAGDAVLLPGFINGHTHLELTHLENQVLPGHDFADWLGRLVEAVRAQGDDPQQAGRSAVEGRQRSLTHGVTTVGDISRHPEVTRPALGSGPLRVVSFGEVIGIGSIRHLAERRLAEAADRSGESDYLRVGVSPHAPYTLEAAGLRACAKRAEIDGLRLCMHLAETPEETEFTLNGSGPLRSHLERLGVWDEKVICPGVRPVAYAEATGLLGPRTLLAHVNYVDDGELEVLARSGVHVVYCPRTHAAFGHCPHRFAEMLARGINVCVGTDSLASNPSLSVLEELRFAHRQCPELAVEKLFEMGTTNSAKALGMEGIVGQIAVGKAADFAVLSLDAAGSGDVLRDVLESRTTPSGTCVGGQWVRPIGSS